MYFNKDLSTPNTMTKAQEKQIQMLEEQNKELLRGSKAGRTAMSSMKKIILEQKEENEKLKNNVLILVSMSEELKKSMDEDEKRTLKLEKRIKELEEEKEKEEEDMRDDFNAEFEIKLREAEKKLKDKILEEELKLKKREKKLQKRIKELEEKHNKIQKERDHYKWLLHNNSKEYKKIIGSRDRRIQRLEDELKAFSKAATHNGQMGLASKAREDKLQEENEKLKNQNEYLWTPVCAEDYIRLEKQIKDLKRLNAIAEERLSLRKDPLSEKLENLLRSAGS
tara:strand:- start:179 stop:1021 length:843 start_codon:yes stop_codon:yes gene_type:complete